MRQDDLFARADDDTLYAALLARDPAWDGRAVVGVTSTGIFCRLTCPARKPKRENVRFYPDAGAARAAGFRPCLRCHPEAALGPVEPLVANLIARLEAEPDRRWSERDISALGLEPSTVRRAFRRRYGMTFVQMARERRLRRAASALAAGDAVIGAQLDAGYASASGFRDAYARMTGEAPAAARGRPVLPSRLIETPIGPMIAIVDDAALLLLEFLERPILAAELKTLHRETGRVAGEVPSPLLDRTARVLEDYFTGRDLALDLPVRQGGSPFARRVREALRSILAGTTTTYGELAERLGRPTAARAVAQANGANRIGVVVPCHRVIGADGSLTGYGGGLWRKRWLIAHEAQYGGPP